MAHPLIMTSTYSMKIFAAKTFANCPETVKFVKVFTCERFPLYSVLGQNKPTLCTCVHYKSAQVITKSKTMVLTIWLWPKTNEWAVVKLLNSVM